MRARRDALVDVKVELVRIGVGRRLGAADHGQDRRAARLRRRRVARELRAVGQLAPSIQLRAAGRGRTQSSAARSAHAPPPSELAYPMSSSICTSWSCRATMGGGRPHDAMPHCRRRSSQACRRRQGRHVSSWTGSSAVPGTLCSFSVLHSGCERGRRAASVGRAVRVARRRAPPPRTLSHTTRPQRRQWCLRAMNPNAVLHTSHALVLSECQATTLRSCFCVSFRGSPSAAQSAARWSCTNPAPAARRRRSGPPAPSQRPVRDRCPQSAPVSRPRLEAHLAHRVRCRWGRAWRPG